MEKRTIKVTNLFIDLDNFRFEHQTSQLEAINRMIEEYKGISPLQRKVLTV